MLDEYFRQYGVIAIFAALAVAVPTSMLIISWFLSVVKIKLLIKISNVGYLR